jgi:hypothetical protein
VLVVTDVLDVLHDVWAQAMLLHDDQHFSVHQIVRPDAVEVTTVSSGEVLADMESLAGQLLAAELLPTFSFVALADLRKGE